MKHCLKSSILFLSICLLAACKKDLNVFPTSSMVDGKLITDIKSAQTVLNGVYYRFADAGADYNGIPSTMWVTVQEANPSELSGLLTYPYGGTPFNSHTYNAETFGVNGIWDYGYNLVNAANGFLKNIKAVTAIPADNKKEMIAEAMFLRAFANSYLLFYYGQYDDINSPYGIIIRNEFVATDNINLPRSSVKDSYDAILSDLDNAIAGLPDRNTQIYYANAWAAKLLKARVLMNRRADGDYAKVISLCNDIISNSSFSLETNLKDIFLNKGLASNEVILGVQPFPNETYKYNNYIYYNQDIGTSLLDTLMQNDPRNKWVYQPVFSGYLGANMDVITKYYPGSLTDPAPVSISNNGYAMRLTEAYLLEAEALVASDGSIDEAKILLKTVLQHAGFTDFSKVDAENSRSGLQLLIIEEEMKNFVAEAGQDWYAVRRLPFTTLQQLIPSIKTKIQLILPIPQDEIKRNSKIKQNPGYGN